MTTYSINVYHAKVGRMLVRAGSIAFKEKNDKAMDDLVCYGSAPMFITNKDVSKVLVELGKLKFPHLPELFLTFPLDEPLTAMVCDLLRSRSSLFNP